VSGCGCRSPGQVVLWRHPARFRKARSTGHDFPPLPGSASKASRAGRAQLTRHLIHVRQGPCRARSCSHSPSALLSVEPRRSLVPAPPVDPAPPALPRSRPYIGRSAVACFCDAGAGVVCLAHSLRLSPRVLELEVHAQSLRASHEIELPPSLRLGHEHASTKVACSSESLSLNCNDTILYS